MKNLTAIFRKVFESKANWAISAFYLALKILKANKINLSFWEGEENWASILSNNKTVGYIWKKYPLVVLEKEIASDIKNYLKDIEEIFYIEVVSLDRDMFKIDDDELKGCFENFNSFNSFTFEDLWFQTNSI
jgi:hypothetical protein